MNKTFDEIQRASEAISMEALPADRPYRLTRDGKELLVGTERECWVYIHRMEPCSVSHALKFEGYAITPCKVGA